MGAESDDLQPASDEPEPEEEDELLWEDQLLRLAEEAETAEARVEPGEETIEQPIAELAGPRAAGTTALWLARWLLLTGLAGGALAIGAIVVALLHGPRPIGWQAGLLAFDCAVIILIVRSYLASGTPVRVVCHRAFAAGGLVAAGFAMQTIVVRSAVRFIYGEPPPAVLTQFFIFGLLGLAGCIIFLQCLRGAPWACRTAAVSSLVFLALVVLQPLRDATLFGREVALGGGLPVGLGPGMALLGAAAVGFVICWDLHRRPGTSASRRWGAGAIWGLLLLALVGYLAFRWWSQYGSDRTFRILWTLSASWEAAGLGVLVLPGMLLAWRRRHSLQVDMLESTHLVWVLVVLGGLACLALWLPTHLRASGLGLVVVTMGAAACMVGAWLGATKGDWVSRWALLPAAGLVVAVLCSLGQVLDLAASGGTLWVALSAFLWSCLVVGLAFAAAGLGVRRRRARLQGSPVPLWHDATGLAALGVVVSVLLLWVIFALVSGAPPVVEKVGTGVSTVAAYAEDGLRLATGRTFTGWAGRAASLLGRAVSRAGEGAGLATGLSAGTAALLFVIAGVHVLAAARLRWSLYMLAALWSIPMLVGSALLLAYGTRLFFPVVGPEMRTAAGSFVATHFSGRLLVMAVLVALMARLWEAYVSVLHLCRRQRREPAAALLAPPDYPPEHEGHDRHLVLLVRLGVILGTVGLVGAALINPHPAVGRVVQEFSALGRQWGAGALRWAERLGALSGQWTGYALGVGIAAYLLFALFAEVRLGRVAAYPLAGVFWTALAAYLLTLWVVAARAGEASRATLAAMAVPVAALLLSTVKLWMRWWKLAGARRGEMDQAQDPQPNTSGVFGLGSLGLVLCVVGVAACLHGALRLQPNYAARMGWMAEGAHAAWEGAAGWLVSYTLNRPPGERALASAALAACSGAVLLVHLLARERVRAFRALMLALWAVLILGGAGVSAYLLARAQPGTWTTGQMAGVFLLAIVVVRVIVAVANAHSWLTPRPG